MARLTAARLHSGTVVGQQVYEQQIVAHTSAVLGQHWDVRELRVRTLRSDLPGEVCLPPRILYASSARTRARVGRCGDAGLLVEPTPAALADRIIDALGVRTDASRWAGRGRARAAQFNWHTSAAIRAQVYRSVWNGKESRQ